MINGVEIQSYSTQVVEVDHDDSDDTFTVTTCDAVERCDYVRTKLDRTQYVELLERMLDLL